MNTQTSNEVGRIKRYIRWLLERDDDIESFEIVKVKDMGGGLYEVIVDITMSDGYVTLCGCYKILYTGDRIKILNVEWY
jgi:hypothetical protein